MEFKRLLLTPLSALPSDATNSMLSVLSDSFVPGQGRFLSTTQKFLFFVDNLRNHSFKT